MKLIQLGGHTKSSKVKAFSAVDDEDFEFLSKYKWSASWYPKLNGYYATRHITFKGKRKTIQMARFILNVRNKKIVDHINGDTLDNTRKNIRIVNYGQNRANSKLNKNNKSGFKGVSFHKGKWEAAIRVKNKTTYLGRFDTKEKASERYKMVIKQFYEGYTR